MIEKSARTSKSIYIKWVKPLIDLLITIILMPIILVLFLIIAILIKADSKGPVIYKQKRLGLNGLEYDIYKFRSMIVHSEDTVEWTQKNDSRITNLGKTLRKYRLDEVPQFFNVIKGDMSLVGPRPELKQLSEIFEMEVKGFKKRLAVKPGITGLAQVNGGYDLNFKQKLVFDLEYIENISLKNDLLILLKTIKVTITGEGSR